MEILKGHYRLKIIPRRFWLFVQARILPQKCQKGQKCAKIAFLRGGFNKGHPIRTHIFQLKLSLGHFLTLVDNLEKKNILLLPFCSNCKGNCCIFTISAHWWTLFFNIFGSSSPCGCPIFIGTGLKNQKFWVDIKRPLTFYSSLNFGHK